MEKFILDLSQKSLPCLSSPSQLTVSSEIPATEDTALSQVEIQVFLHSPPEKHLQIFLQSCLLTFGQQSISVILLIYTDMTLDCGLSTH